MRGREPGRLLLAGVCGAAGLAFGAWMDVYQWTLAAEQNLDTYLAIAGTSLPYNLAHAIGNVGFALLIGPVFVRALARYRRRFQVRWPAPAGAAAASVLLVLLALAPLQAAASPASKAERWLRGAQNRDGGFGSAPGESSGALFSGWAALGLASAGANSRDVRRHGRALATYVRREGRSERDIGEVERTVMALRAAGLAPRIGSRDLVAEIRARRRGDGSIAGYVSYTAFGILALRSAGESAGSATVRWLTGSQNADGGFGVARSTQSDTDMTGATLQALAVTGRARGGVARRAVSYLRGRQNRDGGFGQMEGRDSNAQSTSYAVQGLVAVGSGGRMVSRALAYLRGRQAADGSVAYSAASEQTPVWVTAQALMALRQAALPIAAVARAPATKPAAEAATSETAAEPAAQKEKKEAAKPAEDRKTSTEAGGDGGGRVQFDAEVDDGTKTSAEGRQASEGTGVAPWLIVGGAILLIAAIGPFRSHLLRLVRRS
jgi:hypothetical protein